MRVPHLALLIALFAASPAGTDSGGTHALGGGMAHVTGISGVSGAAPSLARLILDDPLRQGSFKWDAGDRSAEVAADVNQCAYIAPSSAPSGSGGAWVRVWSGAFDAAWCGLDAALTADQSGKLQNAIDILPSTGGLVSIPHGTFLVKAIAIPNHVYLQGQGIAATTLKLPDGANTFVLASAGYATNSATANLYGGVSDLSVDGNRANNTSGSNIVVRGYRFRVLRVHSSNAADYGALVTAYGADGTTEISNGMAENQFEDSYFDFSGKAGWYGRNGPGNHLSDQTITGNVFFANGTVAGAVGQMESERSSGFIVSRNRFYGANSFNLKLRAGGGVFVTENVFDGTNDTAGSGTITDVHISSSGWGMTVIANNQFFHHGASFSTNGGGASAYVGLEIATVLERGEDVSLSGNNFFSEKLPITAFEVTGKGAAAFAAASGNSFMANAPDPSANGGAMRLNAEIADGFFTLTAAIPGATRLSEAGADTAEVGGTATARMPATANYFQALPRLAYVSAPAENSAVGVRQLDVPFLRGDGTLPGGFRFEGTGGIGDYQPGMRFFLGLTNNYGIAGNEEPSSLANLVGIGKDSADINMQLIFNDGSGPATKIDLGANFPADTAMTDVYKVVIVAAKNGPELNVTVKRLNTGDTYRGTLTTGIPANTVFLGPQIFGSTAGGRAAVSVELVRLAMRSYL